MAAKKKKAKKSSKKNKSKDSPVVNKSKEETPICHVPSHGPEALLLHYVANNDAFALSRVLKDWPNLNINRQELDGRTALHLAIELKQTRIVRLLLEAGAKTDLKTITGKTPLMEAVLAGSKEIVQILIQNGSDVNQVDRHEFTALHLSVQRADPVLIKMLLQAGGDSAKPDSDGRTPWHWANYLGHEQIARLFPQLEGQPDVWEQYQKMAWFQQAVLSLQSAGKSKKKTGGKKSKKSKK